MTIKLHTGRGQIAMTHEYDADHRPVLRLYLGEWGKRPGETTVDWKPPEGQEPDVEIGPAHCSQDSLVGLRHMHEYLGDLCEIVASAVEAAARETSHD